MAQGGATPHGLNGAPERPQTARRLSSHLSGTHKADKVILTALDLVRHVRN